MTCFCWGCTSVFLRALTHLDSCEMSLLRSLGSFIASMTLMTAMASGSHLATLGYYDAGVLVFLVLFNNVIGDVFLFLSLHKLGVARGSSISSTYPVFVAIFSHLFFGEKLTVFVVCGTLCVVVGVACLCMKGNEQRKLSVHGVMLAVMASICWSIGLILNKYMLARGVQPDVVVIGRSIVFLIISIFVWTADATFITNKKGKWKNILRRESIFAMLAGMMSLTFGAYFYSCALEHIPASVATPIGAANPLLAAIAALIIFKEKLLPVQWFGIALAIAGSILVAL